MRDPELRPISELAYINPGRVPIAGGPETSVSFIPMADVSESGEWTNHKVRRLREVSSGYTAFAEGDVLFAKITPCMENGKGAHALGLINGVGFGTTEFHVVRAREGISDSRYLYHWLQSRELRLKAESFMIGSAGQQRVQPSLFRHFTIPDFPLPEQRRIARVLDTVDAAIRQTEAVIAKLKQVKAGLLHDLLTRGLDENGELRDPVRHPEQFKDSPLGRVPREWEVVTVEDVVASIIDGPFGSNLKTDHYVEKPGVRVVRLQNIGVGQFDDSDEAYVHESHAASLRRHTVSSGDLLIASLGDDNHPIARACLYPQHLPPAINKADCFRLRCIPHKTSNAFVMHVLNCPSTRGDIAGVSQGVTRDRINIRSLKTVHLSVPPIKEQKQIVDALQSHTLLLEDEGRRRRKYVLLKQGLMQDLLTGRVRVPEEAVEGVTA